MPDGVPEQDEAADWRARLRWIQSWAEDRDPGERRRFGNGDLFEGGVAVAALLVMVAIGVTPWLAVPLSVMTYIAVALLRPARERPDARIDGIATEHPITEALAEDRGHGQPPDEAFTGVGAVAARFGLTRREREVLPLLVHRLTDREIAEQLSISHRTAMNHTAHILDKLGLASRRDVASFVARHALPPPHEPK
jgi:DNA-binding CsgD family transcriptional regulator